MSTKEKKFVPRFRVKRAAITIEKNQPLPPDVEEADARSTYPFASMKPGQSFSFQYASTLKQGMFLSARSCVNRRIKTHPSERYVVRIMEKEGVIRAWRLKDQKA